MTVENIDINSERFQAKLHWACRRGMLELDVILGNFLREAYSKLGDAQKVQFATLLQHPDPDLFSWLMGYTHPEDPEILSITQAIRHHAHTRI